MSMDLSKQRIVVTGGAGFLGRAVRESLARRGVTEVLVPRRRDYDLTREADVARMYADMRPDVVLHLAAEVDDLCHRFLTNPVIEDATVTITAADAASA